MPMWRKVGAAGAGAQGAGVIQLSLPVGTTSWTVPDGVRMVSVTMVGGGGAGASNVGTSQKGGGSGAVLIAIPCAVVPGETLTVSVGAGGVGAVNSAGGSGGDTTFFGLTAGGGAGGNLTSGGGGGTNGSGILGTTLRALSWDFGGNTAPNTTGVGGACPVKIGAGGIKGIVGSINGKMGAGTGTGGGAAYSTAGSGGNGKDGILLIEYAISPE